MTRMTSFSLFVALCACSSVADPAMPPDTMPPDTMPPDGATFVGRWAGQTTVDDLTFAPGRDVRLDEIFELGADGAMRGDFAGWDAVTRCVVTYRLVGTWATSDETSIDVAWTSIRTAVTGCLDEDLDLAETDVIADEGDLWDDELDGVWSVSGDALTIASVEGTIAYERVTDAFVARWSGQTEVDDLVFAEGRPVTLDEVFWMNQDGTLAGYFAGYDADTGCSVDYRLAGGWSLVGEMAIDVVWGSIASETYGCDDPALDAPVAEVIGTEGDLWDEELDGSWTVAGDVLRITTDSGDVIEYRRAL